MLEPWLTVLLGPILSSVTFEARQLVVSGQLRPGERVYPVGHTRQDVPRHFVLRIVEGSREHQCLSL